MNEDLPGEDTISLADLARLRQGAYRTFSSLFLYPDREWMEVLPSLAKALLLETQSFREFAFWSDWEKLLDALGGFREEDRNALEEVYSTDFLTHDPGGVCSLYESLYVGQENIPLLTGDLEALYAREGLTVSSAAHQTPDHASVQLEFMSLLCGKEADGWEEESAAASLEKLRLQERFLKAHLAAWFPVFSRLFRIKYPAHFYGTGCQAAESYLAHELDLIPALIQGFEKKGESCV